jgi:hypothetical protein
MNGKFPLNIPAETFNMRTNYITVESQDTLYTIICLASIDQYLKHLIF